MHSADALTCKTVGKQGSQRGKRHEKTAAGARYEEAIGDEARRADEIITPPEAM
jgi:hypothetical protein